MRDIRFVWPSSRDQGEFVRFSNQMAQRDQLWDQFESLFIRVEAEKALLAMERERLLSVLRAALSADKGNP
jgi:hypothetical protein